MSYKRISPTPIAEGGTAVSTMTTAYAPVCAGTTATGALQVASTGLSTSGFVLTSNGSSALPSFVVAPTKCVVTTYNTATTANHTLNANTKLVDLWMWGAGSGGGSGRRGASTSSGGGGGGGSGPVGYVQGIPVAFLGGAGAVISYTVPAGGLGGAAQSTATTNGNIGAAPLNNTVFGKYVLSLVSNPGQGGTTTTAAGGVGTATFEGYFASVTNAVTGGAGGNVTGTNAAAVATSIPFPTAGGGGAGGDSTTARQAGTGGPRSSWDNSVAGIFAGAAGGLAGSTPGGGVNANTITNYFTGGGGGGGGGCTTAGVATTGGAGGIPGGGGGGGGGSAGTASGAGGAGGNGQIIVIEYL